MNLKKISRREHLLLIIALGILIGMAYVPFRYLPAQKEIAGLIEETEKTWAKTKGIELPNDPAEDLKRLEKEKMDMEQTLIGMREAVASLEEAFAPVDSPEVLHGLQVEILDLARVSGIRILENKPYEPKSPQAPNLIRGAVPEHRPRGVKQSVPDIFTPYSRPMRRLEAAASYRGFKRFIRGLNDLHWRVTLVEFTVEAARPAKRGPGGEPLIVTLILAL